VYTFFSGRFEVLNPKTGRWSNATFAGFRYECHLYNGKIVFVDQDEVRIATPLHREDGHHKINCPSIVFKFLPDTGKALYDKIKFTSNQCAGIPTQCVVLETFRRQKNKDQ
jgi:hypothetical protein